MKKTRPLFSGQRAEIFQAYPPDAFQVCVFHQRFGHVAQGCCSRVLRGELGHARAPVHLTARYRTEDRKSTRLNSSHRTISYAVFCLKKKIESGNVVPQLIPLYIFLEPALSHRLCTS